MIAKMETDKTHGSCFEGSVCFVVCFAVKKVSLIGDAELSAEGKRMGCLTYRQ